MERSKIILIIAGAVMSVLILAVVAIALFIPKADEDATSTGTQNSGEEVIEDPIERELAGENGDPDAADVTVEEDSEEPPPQEMYKNDYSDDTGYTKVADHDVAKSNPDNTVYDTTWAVNTWAGLACDLRTKQTVSARMIKPMEEFSADLREVGTEEAENTRASVDLILSKMRNAEGERLSGEVRNLADSACNVFYERETKN